MSSLLFLKLGGALLTEKDRREVVRRDVLARLVEELASWRRRSSVPLLLAHGSGSFAHVAAAETGFLDRPGDLVSLGRVSSFARRLNTIVVDALLDASLPGLGVPGSLLASCEDGRIWSVRSSLVDDLLDARLLPVTCGDAAPDRVRGGAIASTEPLLVALARDLEPVRIVLATDVDGVFDADPHLEVGARPYTVLRASSDQALIERLGGAAPGATDVTGGMRTKVQLMCELVSALPHIQVQIVSGLRAGAIAAALDGRPDAGGTLIVAA